MKEFYQGTDDLADPNPPPMTMVSAHTLWRANRRSHFPVKKWIMDSGAFTQIASPPHRFKMDVYEYAKMIKRFSTCGELECAITQDYMCEPNVREDTNRTIARNQRDSVARYFELVQAVRSIGCNTPIMPVLQGWEPEDYTAHLDMYCKEWRTRHYDLARRFDRRIRPIEIPERFGLGTMCKRNGHPDKVVEILDEISPYLKGFKVHALGLKKTACADSRVARMIYSSDSQANHFHDMMNGKSRTRESRRESNWKYYKDMIKIINAHS